MSTQPTDTAAPVLPPAELVPALLTPGLRRTSGDPGLEVIGSEPISAAIEDGVVSELVSRRSARAVGLFPFRVRYRASDGRTGETRILVKAKPLDTDVIELGGLLIAGAEEPLPTLYGRQAARLAFGLSHLRELALYEDPHPGLVRHRPAVHATHRDDGKAYYWIAMELLEKVDLMNAVESPQLWQRPSIEAVLTGLAAIHAAWYERTSELAQRPWFRDAPNAVRAGELAGLLGGMFRFSSDRIPGLLSPAERERVLGWIEDSDWWSELDGMPRTLIHGDFNPRNLALRRLPDGGHRLCAYDWELATLHAPQRDLVDFLVYVLESEPSPESVRHYVEYHRRALEAAAGVAIDPEGWWHGFRLCLRDFAAERLSIYLVAQPVARLGFLERITRVLNRLIDLVENPRVLERA